MFLETNQYQQIKNKTKKNPKKIHNNIKQNNCFENW